jgi:predicted ATPase
MGGGLPVGTVTFLFTDIEGSTRLLHELGDAYAGVLAEHHRVLRSVWEHHDGVEVDTAGDAFFVAFADASRGVAAAAAAQAALAAGPVRVRMGLHTGTPLLSETGYVGLDVHKAARIAAVANGGQVLLSAATCGLVDADVRDLGLHKLKDLREPERLFQLGGAEFAPLKSLHATNLPTQANELIGRESEVEDIVAALRGGARLLTLTGPGGTGKTRLALECGAELAGDFPDGVWFVSLAPVVDPELVAPAIAQVLGVRGSLADELQARHALLVLDNLEQVLDSASAIAELLAGAPRTCVLATSRERLGVSAETEYAVPPLETDDGAVLFVERARARGRALDVDEDVREIARRLDGLPLAIELAAARTNALTPAQIRERLGSILDVLGAGARDAPARQRTLRATLEWSHALLDDEEAALFERLGVFPASFDLDAAVAVCDSSFDDLGALVDKSLVRRTGDGRFFLLETIRQFAAERAEARGTFAQTRDRHAEHYATLAAELDPGTRDARQHATVATLIREQPNLRAALARLAEADDPLGEARLVGSVFYGWYLSGQFSEGLRAAEAAWERLGELDVVERGPLANAVVLMAWMTGEGERLGHLADVAEDVGRRFGDSSTVLRAYMGRQNRAASAGRWEEMLSLVEEQLEVADSAGDDWMRAVSRANRAVALRELGDLEASRREARNALGLVEDVGDPDLTVGALCNVGHVELRLGDPDAAREAFGRALMLTAGQPLAEMTIWCLDALAAVEARTGDAVHAARLLGAAEALAASTGYASPGTREELQRTRDAIESALGPEQSAALRADGAALDAQAAIELALTSLD